MPAKRSLPGLPFAGTVADSLEMMRKVWGMTGLPAVPGTAQAAQFVAGLPGALPSMITPTLDVEELDKRIADLRAVEQWLNLNTQLLRTSIQTLEVQRNTIATLKSIGGTMLGGIRGGAQGAGPDAGLGAFGVAAGLPGAAMPTGGTGGMPAAASKAAGHRTPAEAFRDEVARPRPAAASRKRAARRSASPKAAAGIAAAPLNPAAWWNTLQDQFSKVAAAAAAGAEAGKRASAAKATARTGRAVRAAEDAPPAPGASAQPPRTTRSPGSGTRATTPPGAGAARARSRRG